MKELIVIPTPIGNLDEVSKRTIDSINASDVIFCEDTRVTSKLISLLGLDKKRLISYNNFNESQREELIIKTFEENEKVAIVSDAGAPTISDPGYFIVKKAHDLEVKVTPISGPSSIVNFLMGSAVSYDSFTFNGFAPRKELKLVELIENMSEREFHIFFESPNRIKKTLTIIAKNYPNATVVVARELTKLNETFYRGSAENILEVIKEKGEFVIGIMSSVKNDEIDIEETLSMVDNYIEKGMSTKEAIKEVSEKLHINKNEVYKRYHEKK